jgi:hypothetical protein
MLKVIVVRVVFFFPFFISDKLLIFFPTLFFLLFVFSHIFITYNILKVIVLPGHIRLPKVYLLRPIAFVANQVRSARQLVKPTVMDVKIVH